MAIPFHSAVIYNIVSNFGCYYTGESPGNWKESKDGDVIVLIKVLGVIKTTVCGVSQTFMHLSNTLLLQIDNLSSSREHSGEKK